MLYINKLKIKIKIYEIINYVNFKFEKKDYYFLLIFIN